RRALRPRRAPPRSGRRPHRGAGPRRGAHCGGPRSLPLAAAGEGTAGAGPAGVSADLARDAAQAAVGFAAHGGYRPVQLFVMGSDPAGLTPWRGSPAILKRRLSFLASTEQPTEDTDTRPGRRRR